MFNSFGNSEASLLVMVGDSVKEDLTFFIGGDILNVNARLPDSDPNTLGGRSLAGTLVNYFEGRVGAGIE